MTNNTTAAIDPGQSQQITLPSPPSMEPMDDQSVAVSSGIDIDIHMFRFIVQIHVQLG